MRIVLLGRDRFDAVVDTLTDAFRDYPVMRFVVGEAGPRYERRVRMLVGYFTHSRLERGWPVLGIEHDGRLAAAANLTHPEPVEPAPTLAARYDELRDELGRPAIERFEAFAAAEAPFTPDAPHYYLGMIGVRQQAQGLGLGRALLEHIHEMSRAHPRSTGVRLTTERRDNVRFYERFGYRVTGKARVDWLESWSMFRSDG